MSKYAIFLDGGFVKKKLAKSLERFPTVSDVTDLCDRIGRHERLRDLSLLRAYYYDCSPYEGLRTHPLSGQEIDYSKTRTARENKFLIDSLEMESDMAVRRGELVHSGWKLGRRALHKVKPGSTIQERDLVADISQKSVDIKIGLDIATVALKRIAEVAVLVSGDSDFVPAMKLARKEGMKVYLDTLGHGVLRDLKAHADFIF
jgi:uncharacterized LabA/DUF88 family protein